MRATEPANLWSAYHSDPSIANRNALIKHFIPQLEKMAFKPTVGRPRSRRMKPQTVNLANTTRESILRREKRKQELADLLRAQGPVKVPALAEKLGVSIASVYSYLQDERFAAVGDGRWQLRT